MKKIAPHVAPHLAITRAASIETPNADLSDRAVRILSGIFLIGLIFLAPDAPLRWFGLIGTVPLAAGILGIDPIQTLTHKSMREPRTYHAETCILSARARHARQRRRDRRRYDDRVEGFCLGRREYSLENVVGDLFNLFCHYRLRSTELLYGDGQWFHRLRTVRDQSFPNIRKVPVLDEMYRASHQRRCGDRLQSRISALRISLCH